MKELFFYQINYSKFYGYVFDIKNNTDFEIILNNLKKHHKKATHFVYCCKFMENNKFVLKRSDDVEPKGYTTNSMINLIERNNLNNIAFIVVRYFGGIKLGGGKLIQSYNKTINEAYKIYVCKKNL